MTLYHGTYVDFIDIDIAKSHKFKDFGQGFYLTDLRGQAERMAERKANLFGGTPIVQEYYFDNQLLENGELNVKVFERPDAEWAKFVERNRNRELSPLEHGFDIVIGPVADDGVAYLMGRYHEGTISIEQLAKELEYKKLNNQYLFASLKAVRLLERIN